MKYIVWTREEFYSTWEPKEFPTVAAIANAILSGEIKGAEFIITRRMALTITDAEEIPVTESEPLHVPEMHVAEFAEMAKAAEESL